MLLPIGTRIQYTKEGQWHLNYTGEYGTVSKYHYVGNRHSQPFYEVEWDNPEIFKELLAVGHSNITAVIESPSWEV